MVLLVVVLTTCTCLVNMQILFQILLAILKYNETALLNTQDETEAMQILTDFMVKVGERHCRQENTTTTTATTATATATDSDNLRKVSVAISITSISNMIWLHVAHYVAHFAAAKKVLSLCFVLFACCIYTTVFFSSFVWKLIPFSGWSSFEFV